MLTFRGMGEFALRFEGVSKTYSGASKPALDSISVGLNPGEQTALVGRSGSGKSTFLHLAAAIDVPSRGRVLVGGRPVSEMSERERTLLRRDHIGLVFQFFHLLPHLSVLENVLLPAMIAADTGEYRSRATELLDRVGLADRSKDSAERLSGGEMQRIAICRGLLRRPKLLLADEPTGNLDDETGEAVMELLTSVVRDENATLLFVTHSLELAARADRILEMNSGRIEERGVRAAS